MSPEKARFWRFGCLFGGKQGVWTWLGLALGLAFAWIGLVGFGSGLNILEGWGEGICASPRTSSITVTPKQEEVTQAMQNHSPWKPLIKGTIGHKGSGDRGLRDQENKGPGDLISIQAT